MLGKTFAFIIGAAIGSVVTWKLVKDAYERKYQEEVDKAYEEISNRKESADKADVTTNESEYEEIINEEEYSSDDETDETEKGNKDMKYEGPYVITPKDFEFDKDEYEKISLVYYADGVLADSYGEVIDYIDATVGIESLNHFGEYETDTVYVRNDDLETDFEITLDLDRFEDIIKKQGEE